jgi:hypothetical protein
MPKLRFKDSELPQTAELLAWSRELRQRAVDLLAELDVAEKLVEQARLRDARHQSAKVFPPSGAVQ